MPNPKRKLSKAWRAQRRTHDHAGQVYTNLLWWDRSSKRKGDDPTSARHLPGLSTCKRCHQQRMPHRVCGNCGYYGDEPIVKM